MLSVGLGNEQNRIDWVAKKLKELPAGSRLLDAGAGEQQYKIYCSHLKYVSQDFAKYEGVGDGVGLQTGKWDNNKLDIISDITNIPEPDGSFDAIMCTEVFEHIPDPITVIKEFSRLLKKGGVLIVTAPFCSLTHFSPYHFYTGFNRYFYQTLLTKYGFHLLEIQSNGNYFEYLAQEIRRVIPVAKKYSNTNISIIEKIVLGLALIVLQRLSKKDAGSNELLCYGYHVFATKE